MKVYSTRPEKPSHIHHTRPPPPHFGAHTRQKKRNAWVSQLKQARLTSKNKKSQHISFDTFTSHVPSLFTTHKLVHLLACMRCKVFTFVLRNLAKVNYSVIEVNIGDASIFAGQKKANRLTWVQRLFLNLTWVAASISSLEGFSLNTSRSLSPLKW